MYFKTFRDILKLTYWNLHRLSKTAQTKRATKKHPTDKVHVKRDEASYEQNILQDYSILPRDKKSLRPFCFCTDLEFYEMKIFCLTFRDVEEAVVILKRQSFPRIVWRFNIRDVALSCDFFCNLPSSHRNTSTTCSWGYRNGEDGFIRLPKAPGK